MTKQSYSIICMQHLSITIHRHFLYLNRILKAPWIIYYIILWNQASLNGLVLLFCFCLFYWYGFLESYISKFIEELPQNFKINSVFMYSFWLNRFCFPLYGDGWCTDMIVSWRQVSDSKDCVFTQSTRCVIYSVPFSLFLFSSNWLTILEI